MKGKSFPAKKNKTILFRLTAVIAFMSMAATWMTGTEGSRSAYPLGAETVLPGLTPAAGRTVFAEFSTTYLANGFLDAQGRSSVPGFKLSVYAFASKTTDDRLLGVIYSEGNRGRDLAIGPEVHYQVGPLVLIAKYFRYTLVENRPCGNAFWIEFAVPLSHPHPNQQTQQMSRLN
jgi:hypothetical protein